MERPAFPPRTTMELPGWALVWAAVRTTDGAAGPAPGWDEAARRLRERVAGGSLTELEPVAVMRRLFREAGTDPTRYRPSSEALARRVLRDRPPPPIHPLVDFNNRLSVRLLLPCCVVRPETLRPPLRLRRGRAGERFESLRGPFGLEGRPVLEDADGPFGTPITDSERVRILPGDREAWLVVYAWPETVPAVLETVASAAAADPTVELTAGPVASGPGGAGPGWNPRWRCP